jgi:hypothetical protein
MLIGMRAMDGPVTRKRPLIRAKPRFCPDEKRSKAMEGFDRNLV